MQVPGPRPSTISAGLIVCEQEGRWAVALQRWLAGRSIRVFQTRSLAQCWRMLADRPASFLVVEVTAVRWATLLDRLGRLERDFPAAAVWAVADRGLGEWEWALREAGVLGLTTSTRHVRPVAQVAARHLDRVPRPPMTLTDRIWAELPWS